MEGVRCSVLHDDVTGHGLMQCSTGPNPRPRVMGKDSKNNTRDNNIHVLASGGERTLISYIFGHDFSFGMRKTVLLFGFIRRLQHVLMGHFVYKMQGLTSPSGSALMMTLKGLHALYVQVGAQTPRRSPLFPTPQSPDCSHLEQRRKRREHTRNVFLPALLAALIWRKSGMSTDA